MDEKVIHLEDGSTVSAKVNFAVMYYIQKFHLDKMIKDSEERKKESTEDPDADMELCARMLHVLLLSNGKRTTFEEALVLLPLDNLDEFQDVFDDFSEKLENFKKKQDAKQAMKSFTMNAT